MRFSTLAAYLERLEGTTSRNTITVILAELFREIGAEEIDKACYLLLGELVPSYRGIEFNIAERTMVGIIARAYERTPREAEKLYQATGDYGDVAYALAARARTGRGNHLSVDAVYERLWAIAAESGLGSQERRISGFATLLRELDPRSAKFVARIPVGKLRLGFSDATLLDALSIMAVGSKAARKRIETAYNVTADIGALSRRLKAGGLPSLARVEATPGIPIRPSLAERLNSIEDIIVKAGPEVAVEPKLDGFRTQIHVWYHHGAKDVALFSRNLENTTAMFPEIARAARHLRVRSAILDGEAIGFNVKTGRYAPFQETAQRKRKHDIEAFSKKIPLIVLVFDVLYLNGRSLLKLPQGERRRILERLIGSAASRAGRDAGDLRIDPQRVTNDPAVIAADLRANVAKGLEGLVLKNLTAPYQAGSRGFHWIKLKATTAALAKLRAGGRAGKMQLPDTIDCVVMGAYRGRGKRAAFGVGGFLLGVRGPGDRYSSISRLGSGLSDAEFRATAERIAKLKTAERPTEYAVLKDVEPDVWVRPKLVVEILADEISRSSRHTAGVRAGERGYSLRFPRLVRFRDDKDPEDATTVAEVAKMARVQVRR